MKRMRCLLPGSESNFFLSLNLLPFLFDAEKTAETYLPDGVELTLQIKEDHQDAFLKAVADASAGQIRVG